MNRFLRHLNQHRQEILSKREKDLAALQTIGETSSPRIKQVLIQTIYDLYKPELDAIDNTIEFIESLIIAQDAPAARLICPQCGASQPENWAACTECSTVNPALAIEAPSVSQ